jgi:hypothetical protein
VFGSSVGDCHRTRRVMAMIEAVTSPFAIPG